MFVHLDFFKGNIRQLHLLSLWIDCSLSIQLIQEHHILGNNYKFYVCQAVISDAKNMFKTFKGVFSVFLTKHISIRLLSRFCKNIFYV